MNKLGGSSDPTRGGELPRGSTVSLYSPLAYIALVLTVIFVIIILWGVY